jgi:hypothetical protein
MNLPEASMSERYDRLTDWATPVQVGFRYGRGRKKFAWAETGTGEAMSAVEDPWELGIGVNVLLSPSKVGDLALSLEYRRQQTFEEETKREVCQPIAGSTSATTCRSLAFGRYSDVQRNILTGIVRKWIGSVAADLRYSWDRTNKQHVVEVLFYFLSVQGKGLTGGIAPSWASDNSTEEDGWTVRAFIGDVISIWPRPR